MVSISQDVVDVIGASDSAKMMATVDAEGVHNVVPVWSIIAVDSETIAFADLFTKENLEKNKKVAIAVFKGPMLGYQLKGTFAGHQTSGPVFDSFSEKIMSAIKLQIMGEGIIKVDAVFAASPGQNSKRLA